MLKLINKVDKFVSDFFFGLLVLPIAIALYLSPLMILATMFAFTTELFSGKNWFWNSIQILGIGIVGIYITRACYKLIKIINKSNEI